MSAINSSRASQTTTGPTASTQDVTSTTTTSTTTTNSTTASTTTTAIDNTSTITNGMYSMCTPYVTLVNGEHFLQLAKEYEMYYPTVSDKYVNLIS